MKRITFVGLAFVLNLVLSNVCLLGTAYGAEQPSGVTQQLLSREIPMSFDIVTCAWVKTENGWEPAADSPCASGHCLKKNPPDTRCLFAVASEHMSASLPPSPTADAVFPHTNDAITLTHITRPPPYPGLASVVLRM